MRQGHQNLIRSSAWSKNADISQLFFQHRAQNARVLLKTMGQDYHIVTGLQGQGREFACGQNMHIVGLGKPRRSRKIRAPVGHRDIPAKLSGLSHHRNRVIPGAENEQPRPGSVEFDPRIGQAPIAKSNRYGKRLLLLEALASETFQDFIDISLKISIGIRMQIGLIRPERPPSGPFAIQHSHNRQGCSVLKTPGKSRHDGICSCAAFQHQVNHASAAHAKRYFAIFGDGRVGPHHWSVLSAPKRLARNFAFQTTAADCACATAVRPNQHARPRLAIAGTLNHHNRGQHILRA